MDKGKLDDRYETLYTQLLERGLDMHINNKKRIKTGLIVLIILPAILDIIRILTDSDKIVFLIIWVICMFILCTYLIWIEYIDDSIKKTLEQITDEEAGFDELMIGTEQIGEKLSEKQEDMRVKRDLIHERLRSLSGNIFTSLKNPEDNTEEDGEPESEDEE